MIFKPQPIHKYGVTGTSLKWFINYLANGTQCVKISCTRLDLLKVNCDVPQGSALGAILFILYFNEVPDILDHNLTGSELIMHLYADD